MVSENKDVIYNFQKKKKKKKKKFKNRIFVIREERMFSDQV